MEYLINYLTKNNNHITYMMISAYIRLVHRVVAMDDDKCIYNLVHRMVAMDDDKCIYKVSS